jgi:WD40 repeat protein
VTCVVFSPDGGRVAAGFEEGESPLSSYASAQGDDYGLPDDIDEPLPPEVDELLGDYSVSREWDPSPQSADGVRLPIRIFDVETGEHVASFYSEAASATPSAIDWSDDGRFLLTGSEDGLALWQVRTGTILEVLKGHEIIDAHFIPGSQQVVAVSPEDWFKWDQEVGVYEGGYIDAESMYLTDSVEDEFTCLACRHDGMVALGMENGTVLVLFDDEAEARYLEGHTRRVTSLSFSADGRLLATKSLDGIVRIWECANWEALSDLREPARGQSLYAGLAFGPSDYDLATLGPAGRVARLWSIDFPTLAARREIAPTTHYSNAKVVLVGDSGVGKSGLGLVLAGEQFRATESSHGRSVWLIDQSEVSTPLPARRETYLWDLAGQPGYRLLHQLHLGDVAVAIVVFDARSESEDPFTGVRHWVRALSQRGRDGQRTPAKLLVAARIDRGGPAVSEERVQRFMSEHNFDLYLQTSAKEGWGVDELFSAIADHIDWSRTPKVSSTGLFDSIKAFITAERDRDRLLPTIQDLRDAYIRTQDTDVPPEQLIDEFDTCVGRVAARGLIRRLSFGGLVLLRPEVLDAYAAALINAARDQPDASGAISEDAARRGKFRIPTDERLEDEGLERLLLAATVEEVLRHEIALREHSEEGPYLVFPTQARAEAPPLEAPDRIWLTISFEGPVQNIYATLVVRLAHSGLFARVATYRDATTFRARGSVMGMSIAEPSEGRGELRLFTQGPGDATAEAWFSDYVIAHVRRRAIADSVVADTTVRCGECGYEIGQETLRLARDRGLTEIVCPLCRTSIAVPTPEVEDVNELVVKQMDASADAERNLSAAQAALRGKEQVGEFDVFLAHNSSDKPQVRRLADNLRGFGLNPWFDEEQIPPGRWFQDRIENAIGAVRSAAIVIGGEGLGRWEFVEIRAFIAECVERDIPVIPVLLPGAQMPSELKFLKQLGYVTFSESIDDADSLDRLVWGITDESSRTNTGR